MFCPKCGVKNLADVKFCRACGADIHLVPQALAGSLKGEIAVELKGKGEEAAQPKEPPTLEKGFESIFGAAAYFLIVALGYVYMSHLFWIWIWFIIPALERLGRGIGQLIRARREPRALSLSPHEALTTDIPDALLGPVTSEITPPSITEGTTRRLGAAAPRATRNAH